MPARKYEVEPGQLFGRGLVLAEFKRGRVRYVHMLCACGNEYHPQLKHVVRGRSQSCGCMKADRVRETVTRRNTTHGGSSHFLYQTWQGMMQRCYNPEATGYPYYGARGIAVWAGWHDIHVFIDYLNCVLGPRPEGCTMDRIDNDGHYEPGNIRWATASEQQRNQRRRQTHAQVR